MTDLSRRTLLKGASAVAMVSAALPALAKAVPASDPFIERLIARMSIQDKAGQLSIYSDPLAARTEGPQAPIICAVVRRKRSTSSPISAAGTIPKDESAE